MNTPERATIAAIATPAGRGGIGVVRVSGDAVPAIIPALLGTELRPRQAHYGPILDGRGSNLDRGLALYFPAPRSYTGEHVLELHAHGSPVLLDLILERLLELGVRLARPGEFSERAFLNDKLDLAQAEAIADLIAAATAEAVRAAGRSLDGEFSDRIDGLLEALIQLRLYVEAAIDFTDEDIDFLAEGEIAGQLTDLLEQLEAIGRSARQGRLLRDGMTVVIAGRPNAGKSSLLNRLAGRESAIVTEVAGTTRDLLREAIQIDGMPLTIIDTAGLRDGGDRVEQEGMRRARDEIGRADRVLLLIDATEPAAGEALAAELPPDIPVTRIYNKIDLLGANPACEESEAGTVIRLSARTGAGCAELGRHLKAVMGFDSAAEGVFSARRRHLDALARAGEALRSAEAQCQARCLELLAEELRAAQVALGEITGVFTSDDLLGRIFADFCIGK